MERMRIQAQGSASRMTRKTREVPLKNGGEASAAPSIQLHVLHACLDKKVHEGEERRVSQPPIIFFILFILL